jgi:hypothetical protein
MKYISGLILIIAFSFTTGCFAQQGDTIKVYVNGKLAGKEVLKGQSEKVTAIKTSKYAGITKLKISVNQSTAKGSIFKRGLEVEGNGDTSILHVNEMSKSPGCFTIDVAKAKAIAKSNKDIKVYYTEDPKNPRMMVRSLRKLIATLHFE